MKILFYLLVLLLPSQLGRHFWPSFSFTQGIRVDYLSPTIYLTDILVFLMFIAGLFSGAEVGMKIFLFRSCLAMKLKKLFRRPSRSPKCGLRKFYASSRLIYWLLVPLVIGNLFFSQSPWVGLCGLVKLAELGFLGFYVAKAVKTKKELSRIIFLLTFGLVFESFLAIWQFLNQSSIGGFFWLLGERTFNSQTIGIAQAAFNGQLILRPYGTFPHPNVLAGFIVIVMTMLISNLKSPAKGEARQRRQIPNLKKIFFSASLILGTATLFLTISRMAILLWLVVLGFYLGKYFFKLKPPSKKFIIYHLSFIIFLIFVFSRFNFSLIEESFTRREELIWASIGMFKSHPLFGVGVNNFLINLPFFQQTKSAVLYLQPVHNIYLLVLAETGIMGLIVVLWFLTKTLQKLNPSTLFRVDGEQNRTIKAQLLIPLLGILFLGLFDHYWLTLQQGQLLFTLILGLGWSRIKE